jgi:transposase
MLSLGNTTRVFLATGATDMRKGFEGLYALVKERLAQDPLSGHLFVFCNRWRTRIKVLYWDGSGLWICAKRLEKGRFWWPEIRAENREHSLLITPAQWTLLIEGIDLQTIRPRKWHRMGKNM